MPITTSGEQPTRSSDDPLQTSSHLAKARLERALAHPEYYT